MKKIVLIMALAGFTTAFAQVDENQQTQVTKTTVESANGKDVVSKNVTIEKKQELKLQNTGVDKTNYSVTMSPVRIDTDVSYNFDNKTYSFQNNDSKYQLMRMDNDNPSVYATMKPSSQKGYYLVIRDNENSLGYFNKNGNFVIESYDPKTDVLKTTVYVNKNSETIKKMPKALNSNKLINEDVDGDGMR